MPETTTDLPIELTVQDVQQLIEANDPFFLLDCREPFEHEIASIAQATLIPMGELNQRAAELEPHRNNRIVVLCHHGRRSLMVANALRSAGFNHAQSMSGGIDQWSQEIDPQVPRY